MKRKKKRKVKPPKRKNGSFYGWDDESKRESLNKDYVRRVNGRRVLTPGGRYCS